jgi:hypothetical protein
MPRPRKYPKELVERGVRLALESERPIAQTRGMRSLKRHLSRHLYNQLAKTPLTT